MECKLVIRLDRVKGCRRGHVRGRVLDCIVAACKQYRGSSVAIRRRGGMAEAFTKAGSEQINVATIKSVEKFILASTGEKYLPYVTLGTAHPDFVKAR